MWQKSKLSLLLLVVLFCSPLAYSQDVQADITIAELDQMFQQLDELSTQNQILTDDYNELNQKYQNELMILQQEVKLMQIESQVRSESLAKLESETAWTKVGIFATGFSLGFGTSATIQQLSQ